MDERTASIYTLTDPRTSEVRYVGVTAGSLEVRLKGHLRYKGKDHRSLLAVGVTPVITRDNCRAVRDSRRS